MQRPSRTALTALGIVLGVGTLVAVLGLTTTTANQISQRFNVLSATEVLVKAPEDTGGDDGAGSSRSLLPEDADDRAMGILGVVNAGTFRTVPADFVGKISNTSVDPGGYQDIDVVAATAGFFDAVHPTEVQGRVFDRGMQERADRVVVLGVNAARRLGISNLDRGPAILLGGVPATVIGILGDTERRPEVLSAILIPMSTAGDLWPTPAGVAANEQMLVDTKMGAAPVVARQVAFALRPDNPSALSVTAPPDPHALHDNVAGDLGQLFMILALVCLVIGGLGIANTMLVSVLERTPEVGLRRALGAHRKHIALQFLTESGIVGTIGGLIGASVGAVTVTVVSVTQGWTPVIQPWAFLPAPVVGTLIGLAAGTYPALRATRIEPVEAFRR
ncbi:ABC transporter permease [Actinokineospora auranticolor]|uniref:ABC transporter permease n=1 Tax=Actinokineospora auranticolor TaxID=155976 RepID=UPI001C67B805|nr:ABC transporter permease [Actinokineospora auranticolor]